MSGLSQTGQQIACKTYFLLHMHVCHLGPCFCAQALQVSCDRIAEVFSRDRMLVSRDKSTKLHDSAGDGEDSENGEEGEPRTFVVGGRWFHFGG